jgi:hypothetical protein
MMMVNDDEDLYFYIQLTNEKKHAIKTSKSRASKSARSFLPCVIRIEMEQRIQQFHDDTKTIPKPPTAKTLKQMNTLKKFIFKNQV